jgi:hypothetical protein
MIIKEADDKSSDFTALRALLARPECSPDTGKRIEREIRNIQAGTRAEAEAAYEMKVHLGASQNFAIIHDLRVEHDGLVAQIDHLIINRLLKIWVCESKSFAEGISINEHGEFAAFYGGKPYGVPSPIEQNLKHILILQRMFDAGVMRLPTRLGFKIQPDLKSLVIVSKGARISRPRKKLEGLDCIVKSDQAITRMRQHEPSALMLAKVIGQDTLADFARKIAKEHRPIQMDWTAKFGVTSALEPSALSSAASPADKAAESRPNGNSNLLCFRCGTGVGYDVAKFCRFNKPRFGGNIFCRACQPAVGGPAT